MNKKYISDKELAEPGFANALEVVVEFDLTEEIHEATGCTGLLAACAAFNTSLFWVVIQTLHHRLEAFVLHECLI